MHFVSTISRDAETVHRVAPIRDAGHSVSRPAAGTEEGGVGGGGSTSTQAAGTGGGAEGGGGSTSTQGEKAAW